MMLVQVNVVSLAKIAKAVGLMAGITSPHSRAGAKLREAEAPFETLVFVRDESVVEIDAMRDKYPLAHELHEAVSYLCILNLINQHREGWAEAGGIAA
jgi:hypothetical protein